MQAYISTFFCREYNIPCQKKVQQNQIKNIIFLLLGGALWVAPTSLVPLVHSQYILCVVAGGMLCIPPTGTQTILQAQTIRTVVLALLVPLVHSQDNTCVVADGMLCIPPTGTQTILHSFQPLCFSYICQAVRKRPVGKYNADGMLCIPPTGTQQSCTAFSRFAFLIFAKQSASALSANIRKATLRVSQDCFVGAGGRTRTDTEG